MRNRGGGVMKKGLTVAVTVVKDLVESGRRI
jgi:hypothetical protein